MAKKQVSKIAAPDNTAREAEAAKTTRLRALRLAKEAELAVKAASDAKEAAERDAAAKLRKSAARRAGAAAKSAVPPELANQPT